MPQRLYRNLGHGKFEDVTVKSRLGAIPGKGMGIAIADFDNDGSTDIFIANDTERNLLFLNQKDGTFQEVGLATGRPTTTTAPRFRPWERMRKIMTMTGGQTCSITI